MTFRKLLNCPTGDARRQAPQVEANGCMLNYLEWDRRFCKRWVQCVGGGVRLGLMLCDKPHEAFIGGSASSIFQLYSLAPGELNTGASTQQPSVRTNFTSFGLRPFSTGSTSRRRQKMEPSYNHVKKNISLKNISANNQEACFKNSPKLSFDLEHRHGFIWPCCN